MLEAQTSLKKCLVTPIVITSYTLQPTTRISELLTIYTIIPTNQPSDLRSFLIMSSPSKRAKRAGLKSLKQFSELTGRDTRYLERKYKTNQLEFDLLLYGAALKQLFESQS